MASGLDGKRVLVTGASGFIGGALVEALVAQRDVRVRALVRSYGSGARLARFPTVEMVRGDILDRASMRSAMDGCDVVFALAFGSAGSARTQRRTTVRGTQNLLQAAREAGSPRVVYTSTISVYGETADGTLDEDSRRGTLDTPYARAKARAEQIVRSHIRREIQGVILQPTVVYGPNASVWSAGPLRQLRTHTPLLVDGGLCNAVYIGDVVQALILSAVRDDALGQTLLISGAAPVLWEDFCGAYEQMLGVSSSLIVSREEAGACARWQRWKTLAETPQLARGAISTEYLTKHPTTRELYGIANRVLPGFAVKKITDTLLGTGLGRLTMGNSVKPLALFNNQSVAFLAAKTSVSIAKAANVLGYRPEYDLAEGMAATREWAAWSNLLG